MDLDVLERQMRRLAGFLPMLEELKGLYDERKSEADAPKDEDRSAELEELVSRGNDLLGRVETRLESLDSAVADLQAVGEKWNSNLAAEIEKITGQVNDALAKITAATPAAIAPADVKAVDAVVEASQTSPVATPTPDPASAGA